MGPLFKTPSTGSGSTQVPPPHDAGTSAHVQFHLIRQHHCGRLQRAEHSGSWAVTLTRSCVATGCLPLRSSCRQPYQVPRRPAVGLEVARTSHSTSRESRDVRCSRSSQLETAVRCRRRGQLSRCAGVPVLVKHLVDIRLMLLSPSVKPHAVSATSASRHPDSASACPSPSLARKPRIRLEAQPPQDLLTASHSVRDISRESARERPFATRAPSPRALCRPRRLERARGCPLEPSSSGIRPPRATSRSGDGTEPTLPTLYFVRGISSRELFSLTRRPRGRSSLARGAEARCVPLRWFDRGEVTVAPSEAPHKTAALQGRGMCSVVAMRPVCLPLPNCW